MAERRSRRSHRRRVAGLVLDPAECADPAALRARLEDLVAAGVALVVCDLDRLATADLATVDALCRLQLAARQAGCRVRFRSVPHDLRALLALTGLDAIVGLEPSDDGPRGAEGGDEDDHEAGDRAGDRPRAPPLARGFVRLAGPRRPDPLRAPAAAGARTAERSAPCRGRR